MGKKIKHHQARASQRKKQRSNNQRAAKGDSQTEQRSSKPTASTQPHQTSLFDRKHETEPSRLHQFANLSETIKVMGNLNESFASYHDYSELSTANIAWAVSLMSSAYNSLYGYSAAVGAGKEAFLDNFWRAQPLNETIDFGLGEDYSVNAMTAQLGQAVLIVTSLMVVKTLASQYFQGNVEQEIKDKLKAQGQTVDDETLKAFMKVDELNQGFCVNGLSTLKNIASICAMVDLRQIITSSNNTLLLLFISTTALKASYESLLSLSQNPANTQLESLANCLSAISKSAQTLHKYCPFSSSLFQSASSILHKTSFKETISGTFSMQSLNAMLTGASKLTEWVGLGSMDLGGISASEALQIQSKMLALIGTLSYGETRKQSVEEQQQARDKLQ